MSAPPRFHPSPICARVYLASCLMRQCGARPSPLRTAFRLMALLPGSASTGNASRPVTKSDRVYSSIEISPLMSSALSSSAISILPADKRSDTIETGEVGIAPGKPREREVGSRATRRPRFQKLSPQSVGPPKQRESRRTERSAAWSR
jgi:hypothetical protein